jgi:hypothetical protein
MISRSSLSLDGYELHPHLLNVEEYVSKIPNPVILNDLIGPNFQDAVIEACVAKKEDADVIYSCECGELEGNYYKGIRCEKCGSVVDEISATVNDVVLEIPYGGYILHPIAYLILKEIKPMFNYLDIILDMKQMVPKELSDIGITGKGWSYVNQNLFNILESIRVKLVPQSKRQRAKEIIDFLYENRNIIFINKIVLSSKIHTMEKASNKHKLVDGTVQPLLSAILDLLTYQSKNNFKIHIFDDVLHGVYKKYIEYITGICDTKVKKKKAIVRGNIYGACLFWTIRAVINPITKPHRGDEIWIPWEAAVELLSFHLINKLTKRGMTTQEAIEYKDCHILHYSEVIDECFKELIADSPYPGIPVLMNRNPTIRTGSIVLVYITKIKFGSRVISISDLVLRNMNADFDGDNLNIALLTEGNKENIGAFMSLHPMYQTIGYGKAVVNVDIPSNLLIELDGWYQDDLPNEYVDPAIVERLAKL